jgi:hypothetical protein
VEVEVAEAQVVAAHVQVVEEDKLNIIFMDMKKITYIIASMLILSLPLSAQSEVDALRFSREDLHGTARAMAMGGAFGALGGDLTGVNINPAGIAVYRSSEVVGTLNLSLERSTEAGYNADKSQFGMDNLGFVGYFPLRNDIMPHINFGFSFNKLKSFDKDISALGNSSSTLIDYIYSDYQYSLNSGAINNPDDLLIVDGGFDPFLDQPWLSVLGRNSFLIHPNSNNTALIPMNVGNNTAVNEIVLNERGYIDNYDFTVGTTINNVLNLGFSLTIKDISYSMTSDYLEDFTETNGYTLSNKLTTSGAGVSAKFGAIYRPMNELRLGLAYHTPTYYALTETFWVELADEMSDFAPDYLGYEPGVTTSNEDGLGFINDYDLRTPGKFVVSAATVLGNRFIASVDYELVDYSKMKLSTPSNTIDATDPYEYDNEYISTDFRNASTIKIGTEYRFTPKFYGRLGYAWMQNPYQTEFKKAGNSAVAGSNLIFRMEGDTNYFTGGLGYRFNQNFFLDLAIVYKTQTDDLYPFPNVYAENIEDDIFANPFELKNSSYRGLITLGYKF